MYSSYSSVPQYGLHPSTYGRLEDRVMDYAATFQPIIEVNALQQHYVDSSSIVGYKPGSSYRPSYDSSHSYNLHRSFLKTDRPVSQFVNNARLIRQYILDAFRLTAGRDLPDDIVITVLSPLEMRVVHSAWHPGILGFSLNRLGFGNSEIFLLENDLDVLLVTAGHELGHVASFPAESKIDEEAKAFAFEAAWIRSLFKENIAGMKHSLDLNAFVPAANGLHNVAFDFIRRQLFFGVEPLELFNSLSRGDVKVISG